MKKNTINKVLALVISFCFLIFIDIFNIKSIYSYSFLLILITLNFFLINSFKIISPSILFLAYYIYSIGLGPIILMKKEIFYNYDYFNFILGPLLLFSFGDLISKRVKLFKFNTNLKKIKIYFPRKYILYILYFISIVCTLLYVLKNKQYLFGNNLESGRMQAAYGNGLLLYGMQLSIVVIPMLIDMYYKRKNNKSIQKISKINIIFFSILSFILMLFTGFRANSLTLLICIIISIAKKKNISNFKIILSGFFCIILVSILGVMRLNISGGKVTFVNSFFISLYVSEININYVMNTFPKKVPFQYGYTYLINLKMLLPGPDPDFTLWLKEQVGIVFAGGGVTPTLNGEFYLNFGYFLVFLGFFIMGIISNILDKKFTNENGSFLSTFYVWQFAHCITGGIANVMVTVLLFTIVYKVCIKFIDDNRGYNL